ncbi:MAG: DNA/RNA nuclease SfsA [Vallitaleaceae bacterium]|jgi:sugar fermentation stimulation protein A|nr:DNA/RNA nuclease SfsA [Vallitaleaceae bacterium]
MKYQHICEGRFIERPNRFIAIVEIEGACEKVHVMNTGRCKELLTPNASVYVNKNDNPSRKTKYSLISVYKGDTLINMDSQVPNRVVYDGIMNGQVELLKNVTLLQREKTYKDSRFDMYFEQVGKQENPVKQERKEEQEEEQREGQKNSQSQENQASQGCLGNIDEVVGQDTIGINKGYIEVKGVTLEENGVALFPDAPTVRGVKHIHGLIDAVNNGYMGVLILLIQMEGVTCFKPNRVTDPKLSHALTEAKEAGVIILAYDSVVTRDEIVIGKEVPVILYS